MPVGFRVTRWTVLTAVAAAASTPAEAQTATAPVGEVQVVDPVSRADLLYFADQAEAAYELLVGHLETDSDDYGALWRAARAGVVAGLERSVHREQNTFLDPALHFGERAVEVAPDGIDGLYWRGVAAGRRAMNASPGYAVELAQVTYDDAHAILAVDSLHPGALNMLGKLNYEIMTVSWVERAIAKLIMGNEALDDTSWDRAETYLVRAVRAAPDLVLFRYDLAQLYRRRGRTEDAIGQLEIALSLPTTHPIDDDIHARARDALEELSRR